MKKVNCYGKANRRKLVEKYEIKPLLYTGLLADQEKSGCCGILRDRYYALIATEGQAPKKEFSFYAGKHCAEEILKLINVDPLPYVNPFRTNGGNVGQATILDKNKNNNAQRMHPVNRELINAIYVITWAWNSPPPTSVLKIIDYTKRLGEEEINEKGIAWVNKSLSKDHGNRTLSQMYSALKRQNSKMKEMGFEGLRNKMSELFPNEKNRY